MSEKHTPGSWHACCIEQTPHYVFGQDGETTICRIEINDPKLDGYEPASGIVTLEDARANARLIAAAPCLLQFIEAFQAESYIDFLEFKNRFGFPKSYLLTKAGEIIAKATGKDQP